MTDKYEPVEIVAPEGVTFVDGLLGPRTAKGAEYVTYTFGMFDIPPEEVDTAKEKLASYYQRWLGGFCLNLGVQTIEWRTKPSLSVHAKSRSKKKLSNVKIYSRFYSPEAYATVNFGMDAVTELARPAQ